MIDRYSRKIMTDIWSEKSKFEIWFQIKPKINKNLIENVKKKIMAP